MPVSLFEYYIKLIIYILINLCQQFSVINMNVFLDR